MVRWLVLCASTAGGVGSIPGWGTKAPVPCVCVCVRAQLCPTLCDPMDYSLPGSSVHGIFQARNTGVGCYFLGDLTNPGIESASLASPVLAGRFFTTWAIWEAPNIMKDGQKI